MKEPYGYRDNTFRTTGGKTTPGSSYSSPGGRREKTRAQAGSFSREWINPSQPERRTALHESRREKTHFRNDEAAVGRKKEGRRQEQSGLIAAPATATSLAWNGRFPGMVQRFSSARA